MSLSDEGARLNFGAVMAAVDLAEHNENQLRIASEIAALIQLPLVLMTVAEPDVTEQDVLAADADPRAGRLVAPDEGAHPDEEAEEIATDVGRDGYAASAEEAAVHIEDEQR